ncbi:methionine--tRNA ligase [Brucepastera parasyntrophica]|uniref:methionine--tRNA ligase n=1 Tax=Brucepastera parasyntrophica TaxID=2880008 RepID=UPI00210ED560|nr:methionine--tRNA ligase [Brucepastera parasyntrophica]ULQ60018.1 methionine--tRNA ligase [Brucepastera parasyntrophica]
MKKKLVTSALPYVNNVPHLGNLIQVLSADVYSRFCRLRGYETLYICGTDEYGTATETKAQEEGKTPRELCDYYYAIHSDIYNWFGIAFDNFGRTSTPQHTEITQKIFLDLEKNGYIKEHTIEQLYCPSCARFLADRYVRGTCPSCGYEDARGDQCENCGKLLDPVDLKNPRCSTCGSSPEMRETKHLYIDLPAILPQYEKWMATASAEGKWAKNAMQMTQAWIRDGLQERAITRDLKWGIPVPKAGFENKVFYVWFDAPIGYISITKCLTDQLGTDWKTWWLEPENIELFQFIGKDNIPFHTVIFPSSLIGSGENWTKLFHMSSTEYLNYESGKFSKSKGIGVFGSDAKESGIPADMWRFYIFYNRPEKSDALFTWKDFQEKINSELIGNLGNLVNRTLTFVFRYYEGKIPEADGLESQRDDIRSVSENLRDAVSASINKITELLEWAELRDAFREIFALSSVANKAFQDGEPWKTRTSDPEKAEALLRDLCYLIKNILIFVHPFMPRFADTVASFFGKTIYSGTVFDANKVSAVPQVRPNDRNVLGWNNLGERTGLSMITQPEIIYKPMDSAVIEKYREQYSGSQKERSEKEKTAVSEKAAEEKPADIPEEDIFNAKIALKTAKIIKIEKHPDAEKLYIETLDDGSGTERVILSGLVPYLKEEDLLGKSIIIADNLKPRKMRGIESRGMLLAADYTDAAGNEQVEVLDSSWAVPGTPVMLEGADSSIEKPAEIDADTFFSVKMKIIDNAVTVNGKKLLIGGKPVMTKYASSGEVS